MASPRIPYIGPSSLAWLRRVGVTTVQELRKRGAPKVYRDLVRIGHPENKRMWQALLGADLGIPLRFITNREKKVQPRNIPVEPRPKKKHINGVNIRYWELHSHQSKVVFFWHGFRGSHRGLLASADYLRAYRVIIPDLPGWGESDPLPVEHTLTNSLRFLKKFIASFHQPDYFLAGHSFGATLALMYAARHPRHLRRLLLVEPVINATSFTSRLGEVYYSTAAKLPVSVRRRMIANPILNRGKSELLSVETDWRRRRRLVSDEQKNLHHVRDWVEIETYRSLARTDYWTAMKSLVIPVTLLAGTRDRMTPLPVMHKIAATIPRCEIVILKNAGHFVPMEKPDILGQALNQALDGNVEAE